MLCVLVKETKEKEGKRVGNKGIRFIVSTVVREKKGRLVGWYTTGRKSCCCNGNVSGGLLSF